jgi:predicted dehydrogenase
MNSSSSRVSRRRFLAGTGAALATPYLMRSSRAQDKPAPSNRIAMGLIGFRNMGAGHLQTLIGNPEVQVVAVCDVDAKIRSDGKAKVDAKYGNKDCAAYNDFRELIARPDIDAVMIATPDHWHVPMSLAAVRAGKDVYCEKPLTLFIEEGRVLSDTVRQYGRVFQTGSQQRSTRNFRFAAELVRNGRIGQLQSIEVGIPKGRAGEIVREQPVPAGFDYDMWLGPAPEAPFHEARCHYNFRWILDYSGGQVTNFGAHDLDIAQWALDMDNSGPVEVEGTGDFPDDGLYNTAVTCHFEAKYANGVKLTCQTGNSGIKFIGTEGWIYVNRGELRAEPSSLLSTVWGPNDIRLYESRSHWGNFLDCVRTRRDPVANVEIGHRTATFCHLANIAMLLGRRVQWNPEREEFVNDAEANRLKTRALRAPWHL